MKRAMISLVCFLFLLSFVSGTQFTRKTCAQVGGNCVPIYSCQSLNSSNTYYLLMNDVRSDITCFKLDEQVGAYVQDIVLDLNGYTVTYDDFPSGIPNADFEIAGASEEIPLGWDLTLASAAKRTSTSTKPLNNKWFLKLEIPMTDQTLISPWVELPPDHSAVSYIWRGDEALLYDMTFLWEVEYKDLITGDEGIFSSDPELDRGYTQGVFSFKTLPNPAVYRLKLTYIYPTEPVQTWQPNHAYSLGERIYVTGSSDSRYPFRRVSDVAGGALVGTSGTVEPDWICGSQVVADNDLRWGFYGPITGMNISLDLVDLRLSAITGSVSDDATNYGIFFYYNRGNITIRNGRVVQGRGKGYRSHSIVYYSGVEDLTLENLYIETSGYEASSININDDRVRNVVIRDCTIVNHNPNKENRHQLSAAVNIMSPNARIYNNNITTEHGWGCIYLSTPAKNTMIYNNILTASPIPINHHPIVSFCPNNLTIFNNTIISHTGHGILFSGDPSKCRGQFGHSTIYGNTIVLDGFRAGNDNGDGIRLNDYQTSGMENININSNNIYINGWVDRFYNYKYTDWAGDIYESFLRMNGIMTAAGGPNINVTNNYIKIYTTDDYVYASGITTGSYNHEVIFENNTIESNNGNIMLASYVRYCYNSTLISNTLIKSGIPSGRCTESISAPAYCALSTSWGSNSVKNAHLIDTNLIPRDEIPLDYLAVSGSLSYSYYIDWYIDILVKNSQGTLIPNAIIQIFNRDNSQVFNGVTNEKGRVNKIILNQFEHHGGLDVQEGYYNSTPHTITVSAIGYQGQVRQLTMDESKEIEFIMSTGTDAIPPSLSNGQPSGEISGTTATLSLTTDEIATCKYSTSSGTGYLDMPNTFSSTFSTAHSTPLTDLQEGATYTYYVRCMDISGNANTVDFPISFSVAQGGIPVPPPSNTDDLDLNSQTAMATIFGERGANYLGISVSSGDINGDGYKDMITGGIGSVNVVFGSASPGDVDLHSGTADWSIIGDGKDYFGHSVSSGDINGDGYDDVIISAYDADTATKGDVGKTYVVFGSSNPSDVDLRTAQADMTITGQYTRDYERDTFVDKHIGGPVQSVSSGDINNDGYDDLIIGTAWANPGGRARAGEVYVILGSSDPSSFLSSANADIIVSGSWENSRLGWAVSSGDINGDGYDDIITGAYLEAASGLSCAGNTYVIFGSSSPSNVDLSASNADMTISGKQLNSHSGYAVSSGDVNNDGYDDVVIGAYFASPFWRSRAGEAYVVFGSSNPGDVSLGNADYTISGASATDYTAHSVSSGDVNNDGYDDVIMGSYYAPAGSVNLNRWAGKTYVVFGSGSSKTIDLASESADITVIGKSRADYSGYAVSSGDLNNDGYVDIIIGSYGANPSGGFDAGAAYAVFGSSNPSDVDLSIDKADITVSGDNGGEKSGRAIATGDINNDGYDDVIIGASGSEEAADKGEGGKAYVIFGSSSPEDKDLSIENADITISSSEIGEFLGHAVAAGDINGDNYDDIIIGAYGANPAGGNDAGRTYVFFGSNIISGSFNAENADVTISGNNAADYLGFDVASGNFNGDNYDDIVMTTSSGAYVILGSSNLQDIDLNSQSPDFLIISSITLWQTGHAVAAGDINNDGYDDVILGSYNAISPKGRAGQAYVIFGSSNPSNVDLRSQSADITISGVNDGDSFGKTVSSGDINGDNYDDVIVGAVDADPGGASCAGETYVIFGSSNPSDIDLSSESAGLTVRGNGASDFTAVKVSSGDINNDGFDDVIVGANGIDTKGGYNSGAIYVVYGSSSPSDVDLKTDKADRTITGDNPFDDFGYGIAAGDFNGDGYEDIIASARAAEVTSGADGGRTYIISGKTGASIPLSGLAGLIQAIGKWARNEINNSELLASVSRWLEGK